jgi:hypothetical protein
MPEPTTLPRAPHSSETDGRKKKNETIYQSFIDFREANYSDRRAVLYSTLIEFWLPLKLIIINKTYLNETCNKILQINIC